MTRLYLHPHGVYRVRMRDAREVRCRWDDSVGQFVGPTRRLVVLDEIAAVSSPAHMGRATTRWTPLGRCYRAIHEPRPAQSVWRHPYAARCA